jgi:hypothetical protein
MSNSIAGDEYVDPLIKRGEELKRIVERTPEEESELRSLQVYAAGRIRHLAQFPLANTSAEESAQYLAEQEARSAHEREAAALKFAEQAWQVLKPILLGLARDAIASGVKRLELPAPLAPVAAVVSGSVDEAVRAALDDVKP